MPGAEARLQLRLDRIEEGWAGLRSDEVEPTSEPGVFVFRKLCTCYEAPHRSAILMPVGGTSASGSGGGVHHHYLKTGKKLWEAVSEERGWPQARHTMEAFIERWSAT